MGEALGDLLVDVIGLELGDVVPGMFTGEDEVGAPVAGVFLGEGKVGAPVTGLLMGDPVTGALDMGDEVLADLDAFVDLAATDGIVVLDDFSALEF